MANATTNSKPAGGEKKKDDMLNLFQTEVVEDSHLGKLVDSLQDIPAEDLLKQAVTIRDWLRGPKR